MPEATLRQKLHTQIDSLPDEIVEQIADFTLFVITRHAVVPEYAEWANKQWADFALEKFFRDEDEVEYSLEDALEIYRQ